MVKFSPRAEVVSLAPIPTYPVPRRPSFSPASKVDDEPANMHSATRNIAAKNQRVGSLILVPNRREVNISSQPYGIIAGSQRFVTTNASVIASLGAYVRGEPSEASMHLTIPPLPSV